MKFFDFLSPFSKDARTLIQEGPPQFSFRDFFLATLLGLVVFAGFTFIVIPDFFRNIEIIRQEPIILFGSVSMLFSGAIIYVASLKQRRRMFFFLASLKETNKLHDALEQNFITNLVKINFKYIDAYYLQTQVQANKSFTLTFAVAIVSFIMIGVAVTMMFYTDKLTPAYVTAGAGILTQFISGVFFYLYNQTIQKMGEYHKKLVFTQNISLALKISETLPKAERAKSQELLIERLSNDLNQYLSR